ncbi:MAG TPA: hypothetical protein VH724_14075 [Candidatus Angelobacter sp.]|nr:hypothetical protein [Candidatus Angelobacter sp.]
MKAILLPVLLLCAAHLSAQTPAQNPSQQNAFDDRAASRMLLQLSEALQGHSQKQLLALFDLGKMKDGTLFRHQIESFFSQTESIRVHMNLIEVATEAEKITVSVDAEMEIEPRNGGPAVRRNDRLNFVVVSAKDWKFVDLLPRSFFSLP